MTLSSIIRRTCFKNCSRFYSKTNFKTVFLKKEVKNFTNIVQRKPICKNIELGKLNKNYSKDIESLRKEMKNLENEIKELKIIVAKSPNKEVQPPTKLLFIDYIFFTALLFTGIFFGMILINIVVDIIGNMIG